MVVSYFSSMSYQRIYLLSEVSVDRQNLRHVDSIDSF